MVLASCFPCLFRRFKLSDDAENPRDLVIVQWNSRSVTPLAHELTLLLDQIRTATNGVLAEPLLCIIGSYCNPLENCLLTVKINPQLLDSNLKASIAKSLTNGSLAFTDESLNILFRALSCVPKDAKSEELMANLAPQLFIEKGDGAHQVSKLFPVQNQQLIVAVYKVHAVAADLSSVKMEIEKQQALNVKLCLDRWL
jgi:hypothetical protein